MKRCVCVLALAAVLGLVGAVRAADLVIDSFDDTQYEVKTPSGHANRALVTSAAGASDGAKALQISYMHPPTAAYTANTHIVRTLPSPISLRDADRILIDTKIPVAAPAIMMTIDFIDEKGGQARIVSHDFFSKPTTTWTTRAWSASKLHKSRWVGDGRAVNLDRIVKVSYVIMVQETVPNSGQVEFALDNLRAQSSANPGGSLPLIQFLRYANQHALASGWQPAEGNAGVSLVEGSRSGSKALRVSGTVERPGDTCLAEMAFDSPVDFSTARFVRLMMAGDPALASVEGIALVRLVDIRGNRAEGIVTQWSAERDWSCMHLPFLSDGVERYTSDHPESLEFGGMSCWREAYQPGKAAEAKTDLTSIAKIQLGFRAAGGSGYPVKDASVRFEEIIVGMDALESLGGSAAKSSSTNEPRRTATSAAAAPTPTPPIPVPTVVTWIPSGAGALENALKQSRPVIVYFTAPDTPKCREFEQSCLATPDFIRRTGSFTCIREDVAQGRTLADQFGVFRVPHLLVLSRRGAIVSSLGPDINPRDVLNAMDAIAQ